MKREQASKTILIQTAAIFLAAFLLAGSFIIWLLHVQLHTEQERTLYLASTYGGRIEYVVESLMHNTRTLEALVWQSGGEIEQFDRIAASLVQGRSVQNLAIAPGGIVSQIYPIEGNEAALGHNLYTDPSNEDADFREQRRLSLSGPFELVQGGLGLVGRLPIYLPDEAGQDQYWGLVCITLRFPEALEDAKLSLLEQQGYSYALWRKEPDTGEKQILLQSETPHVSASVGCDIEVPDAVWRLDVAPSTGWRSFKSLWLLLSVSLIVSFLVAMLVYSLLQLRLQKNQLLRLSMTDTLTGLPNRRALFARLDDAIHSGKNTLALCYLDLDGFKEINDTLGHQAGDQILQEAASRLAQCLSQSDIAARIGGDEFVLLLLAESSVEETIKNVKSAMAVPFPLGSRRSPIEVSIGVAQYPGDGLTPDALLHYADSEMYQHKQQHKQDLN